MAETGWPLIPREVLPAPIPAAAKATRRPPVTTAEAGRQLSIFGAETTEPSPFDLAGLLAGPGRLDRMGGTARVSVRVDAAWRVHVLVAELVTRGLVVTWRPLDQDQDPQTGVRHSESPEDPEVPPPGAGDSANPDPDLDFPPPGDDFPPGEEDVPPGREHIPPTEEPDITPESAVTPHPEPSSAPIDTPGAGDRPPALFEVRTAYSSRLKALAQAWPAAADQLFLSGPRLRLWVAAAGRPTEGGYALGLDPGDAQAADAALRRAGLAGAVSDHGLEYVITGRRRLARLAELVGERPAAAPATLWPGGAPA